MSGVHPVSSTAQAADPAAPLAATAADAPATAKPAAAAAAQKQPKQSKADKKKDKGGDLAAGMAQLELDPKPAYFESRIQLFEQLQREQEEMLAGKSSQQDSCQS